MSFLPKDYFVVDGSQNILQDRYFVCISHDKQT